MNIICNGCDGYILPGESVTFCQDGDTPAERIRCERCIIEWDIDEDLTVPFKPSLLKG
jgi:hypothetical protein